MEQEKKDVVVERVIERVVYVETKPKHSPGVAAVLSFVCPGLGQIYKGSVMGGMLWFAATLIGYFMLVVPGVILHIACIIMAASSNETSSDTEPEMPHPGNGRGRETSDDGFSVKKVS